MKITYQGVPGAYSQIAAAEVFPGQTYVACESFEQAAALVRDGSADRAVLPIENSNAGRVTGMHKLLPSIGLYIQGEYFLRVEHQLLGLPAATPQNIVCAVSHPQALAQCSLFLQQHNIAPVAGIGTAKSCEDVLAAQDPGKAAIASKAAAEIYGLKILQANIENDSRNATRFLLLSRQNLIPHDDGGHFITSCIFRIKPFPGALHQALGAFAARNINLTKIESYPLEGKFVSTRFYTEIETHRQRPAFRQALKELGGAAEEIHILGTYAAAPFREKNR